MKTPAHTASLAADELDASQTAIYNREYTAITNAGNAPEIAHDRAMDIAQGRRLKPWRKRSLTAAPAHTPTPWTIDSDGDGKPNAIITSTHDSNGPDDDVCEVYGGNADDDSTRKANAALIASAPDLLAALEAMVDASWNGPIDADHPARQKAADALAKTRGETHGEPEPDAAEPLARIGQFAGGREVMP